MTQGELGELTGSGFQSGGAQIISGPDVKHHQGAFV